VSGMATHPNTPNKELSGSAGQRKEVHHAARAAGEEAKSTSAISGDRRDLYV
jgi:hypothetical protein